MTFPQQMRAIEIVVPLLPKRHRHDFEERTRSLGMRRSPRELAKIPSVFQVRKRPNENGQSFEQTFRIPRYECVDCTRG